MEQITVESLASVAGVAAFVTIALQLAVKPILNLASEAWRQRYKPLVINFSGLALGGVAAALVGIAQGASEPAAIINLALTGLVGASVATKGYEMVKNGLRAATGGKS